MKTISQPPESYSGAHLWLIDYAGHPFTAELAVELTRRQSSFNYSYCASNTTPHADFEAMARLGVSTHPVDLGRSFAKHNPARRLVDELDYGLRTAWLILRRGRRDDHVIACQVPVVSALVILLAARLRRQVFTLWLQDLQASLASLSAGTVVTLTLSRLERLLIRRSRNVLAISEQFADYAQQAGASSVAVVGNWAPLGQIAPGSRVNEWSIRHHIGDDTFRLLYSGTMGSKHRGADVARLAHQLLEDPSLEFVVVASGEGADVLSNDEQLAAHDRFHLLPLQPISDLSNVLATADCLLVTLDQSASEGCVPSKVLSYLCAARPILCLMSPTNPSASLVVEVGAGVCVETTAAATAKILEFAHGARRCALGSAGRRYAETAFEIGHVADLFLAALEEEVAPVSSGESAS